jgi:hypothetical protein
LSGVSPLNTLSAMSESYEVLSQKRPVDLGDAPTGASFPAVEAQVQCGEEAQEVQIFFILARAAAIVLIAALVIGYFIVTFGVAELKALWPRGHISHTE